MQVSWIPQCRDSNVSHRVATLPWHGVEVASGEDKVPIPGAIRVSHLEEYIAAAGVRLSDEDLIRIDEDVLEPVVERYDPGGMRTVGI